MIRESTSLVIIGGGVAGRAAAVILPNARVIARPDATVWHAQEQTLWIEAANGVSALSFERLLLCADEPLLLLSLGCAFRAGQPAVDARGETSRPGVFAAGRVLGAVTCEAASRQARIVARALAGLTPDGRVAVEPPMADPQASERLDPLGIAALLEQPSGSDRNRTALAQAALLGTVLPSRPVGFAALAAAAGPLGDRPTQPDAGRLS